MDTFIYQRPPVEANRMREARRNIRPSLTAHLIAVRDYNTDYGAWTATGERSVAAARRDYDLGLVELIQQKLGDGLFALFAVPRKKPAHIEDACSLAAAAKPPVKRRKKG